MTTTTSDWRHVHNVGTPSNTHKMYMAHARKRQSTPRTDSVIFCSTCCITCSRNIQPWTNKIKMAPDEYILAREQRFGFMRCYYRCNGEHFNLFLIIYFFHHLSLQSRMINVLVSPLSVMVISAGSIFLLL